MKRVFEAALLVAALAIGGFVVRSWLSRRAAVGAPAAAPTRPGPDAEPGAAAAAPAAPPRRGVTNVPMIRLSSPPSQARRESAPPPPPSR